MKIVNGIALVVVWSIIAVIALILMITFYIVGGVYERLISNQRKMPRLRISRGASGSNQHQRGSPFL